MERSINEKEDSTEHEVQSLLSPVKTSDTLKSDLMALVEYIVTSFLIHNDLPCLHLNENSAQTNIADVKRFRPVAMKCLDLKYRRSDDRWTRLMVICHEVFQLLRTNQQSTNNVDEVRRIFYLHENTFRSPVHVADSLMDVASLLNCARRDLNVRATGKGLIYGSLEWRTDDRNGWYSCLGAPTTIPGDIRKFVQMRSDATVVLIVEKDTVFQKLVDQSIIQFLSTKGFKAILITGKGVPDFSTREMLWILKYKVIVDAKFYIITDADPYGIEIVGIYAFGSLKSSNLQMQIGDLRWIGFFPSEIEKFRLDKSRSSSLSLEDIRRSTALMERPWIKSRPQWKMEVQILEKQKCKAEIEALNQFGELFLLKEYILNKLFADKFIT